MEVIEAGFVDVWNSRERLYLASLVLTHGDNNWIVVSYAMKSFANRNLRSLERYSPEKCSAQFAWMIKEFEKTDTTTDDKELRLKRLEHYWRKKRLEEVNKEISEMKTVVDELTGAIKIAKSGALDDYIPFLLEELKDRNDPFWQFQGGKIMESVRTSSESKEIMARVEAPILETTHGQSSLLKNSAIMAPLKEAVKDGVDIEIHSTLSSSKTLSSDGSDGSTTKDNSPPKILPTNEQPLTVINTPEKQSISAQNSFICSSQDIESSPKAFLNPNNPAASSQGTSTVITTTVSSVTLSDLFKSAAVSRHGESNVRKPIATNVEDNLKNEAKHSLIKPSDVTSFLSKTNEQLIEHESAQSGEAISAPTVHSDSNKVGQKKKFKEDFKDTNQKLVITLADLKEAIKIANTQAKSPQNLPSCVGEKPRVIIKKIIIKSAKSDTGNSAELQKIVSSAPSLKPLTELASPDEKLSKHPFEKNSELFDNRSGISTIAKDASVDDSISTSLKSTSVSTPIIRKKESKTRSSPQSVASASQRYAKVFSQRVTDVIAPGYHDVVLRPMDLTTIKRNIHNDVYKSVKEFQRDIMLMFHNALMYYSSDDVIHKMVVEMQADTLILIKNLDEQLTHDSRNPEGENPL